MNRTLSSVRLLMASVAVALGCTDTVVGPADLAVDLALDQSEVLPNGQVTLTVRVHNPSATDVSARAAHCLFFPHVSREGDDVPWVGTDLGCVQGTWTYRIAAGSTDEFEFVLTAAEIRMAGLESPAPAEPGEYLITVMPTIGVVVPPPELVVVVESS